MRTTPTHAAHVHVHVHVHDVHRARRASRAHLRESYGTTGLRDYGTMGLWDYGTMGLNGQPGVFAIQGEFIFWDYGTMGLNRKRRDFALLSLRVVRLSESSSGFWIRFFFFVDSDFFCESHSPPPVWTPPEAEGQLCSNRRRLSRCVDRQQF